MLPALELDQRRLVWEPLSRLYLDTELDSSDYQTIAGLLSRSSYTPDELEAILKHEVGPVVAANLLCVAGEWSGFNDAWLEEKILQRKRSLLRRLIPASGAHRMVSGDWNKIRRYLNDESRSA